VIIEVRSSGFVKGITNCASYARIVYRDSGPVVSDQEIQDKSGAEGASVVA
jgi:phosphotransferase system IIB component